MKNIEIVVYLQSSYACTQYWSTVSTHPMAHLEGLQDGAPAGAQAARVRGDGLRYALYRQLAHDGRIAGAQNRGEGAQRLLLMREVRQLRSHQQL
jgi:hypothetical protein